MPPQPGESVVWIKVTKPTFDLVGVLLSSLGLTTILVGVALVLGIVFGLSLIIRRRRETMAHVLGAASLDLDYR
ncbi:MAG TPA: hypothetical protein VMV21_18305 [Vicinamibacteria bacterium]|jgi:hypothetical protein|nr:hypothetical protein [Vicinamibacteria bacterium]